MDKKIVLILVLYIFLPFVNAQTNTLNFRHIGLSDGLPQNTVNCIDQDTDGFIWVGTNGGLARYDAYTFKVFKHKSAAGNSISNNYVNSVAEDGAGNLLVGTDAGLNIYNPRLENFILVKGTAQLGINKIKKDSRGNIWVASSKGLMLYHPQLEELETVQLKSAGFSDFSSNQADAIEEDKQHFIWVSYSRAQHVLRFDPRYKTEAPVPYADKINRKISVISLRTDSVGNMWLGTINTGLVIVNGETSYFSQINLGFAGLQPISERIRDVFFVGGSAWVATRDGLFVIDSSHQKRKKYLSEKYNPTSLSNSSICSITNDRSGNIWVGTYSGGINVVQPSTNNFNYIQELMVDGGLNSKVVYDILEDKLNNIWIATGGGGLNYYDRQSGKFSYFHIDAAIKGIDKDFIESICLIGDTLFVGTLRGFFCCDIRSKHFSEIKLTAPFNEIKERIAVVFAVRSDCRGGVWVGTQLGVFHRDNNGKLIFFPDNTKKAGALAEGQITALLQDKNGGLWIGSKNGLQYKKAGKNIFKNISDSIKSVFSIMEDVNGTIWVGTHENGLVYVNKETLELGMINEQYGLNDESVRGIVQDKTGDLWISCSNGIAKITLKKKQPPFTKADIQIIAYAVKNGLRSNEYLQSTLCTQAGEIMLGGMNGIVYFDPTKMSLNNYRPPVVITDFQIKNIPVAISKNESPLQKSITYTNSITLHYDEAYFSFRFAALNYINPNSNQYAYMLDGLKGDNWHYVGNEQVATYTNLSPGHYTFKVKAANNDGFWNKQPASVRITILPPVWLRWYAYLFYVIIFIGILLAIYRYYLRQDRLKSDLQFQRVLNERDKEFSQQKIDFFTNISHEIKTPLTLILAPLEKLIQTVNANHLVQQPQLLLMQKNGERLMRLIDQLLDFRRFEVGAMVLEAQKGDIVFFIANLLQTFNDYAAKREIKLEFLPTEKSIEAWFDFDKLEKILYNLLSNALKFTPLEGKVKVFVKTVGGMVEITVEDNGAGIAEDHLDKIFDPFHHYNDTGTQINGTGIGLSFTKGLVLLHHGEISVSSRKPTADEEGYTCFKITLPLGDAHLGPEEKLKGVASKTFVPKLLPAEKLIIPADAEKNNEDEAAGNEKPIIHIVEDNEEVLEFIVSHFAEKYTVQSSANGKMAWAAVVKSIPDIIISDVMMPEMNGIDFCNLVKNDSRTSHIPIILLTARTADEYKMDGYRTGADDYVTKPFSLKLLEIRVENLLKSRKVLQELFKKDITLQPKNIAITGPDEQFLQSVMDFIEENIMEPTLTVKELSKAVNMTGITLLRKIKALTDLTVIEFIRSIRLKRAAQIFQKESYSVSEVCYMTGFTDVDYFRKCFKSQFDMSPKEYCAAYSNSSFEENN